LSPTSALTQETVKEHNSWELGLHSLFSCTFFRSVLGLIVHSSDFKTIEMDHIGVFLRDLGGHREARGREEGAIKMQKVR
jgi:hypothetical protein